MWVAITASPAASHWIFDVVSVAVQEGVKDVITAQVPTKTCFSILFNAAPFAKVGTGGILWATL